MPFISLAEQGLSLQMLRLAARQQTVWQSAIFSWTGHCGCSQGPSENREIYLIACGMFWYLLHGQERLSTRRESHLTTPLEQRFLLGARFFVAVSHTCTLALSHSNYLVLFHTLPLPSLFFSLRLNLKAPWHDIDMCTLRHSPSVMILKAFFGSKLKSK